MTRQGRANASQPGTGAKKGFACVVASARQAPVPQSIVALLARFTGTTLKAWTPCCPFSTYSVKKTAWL